MLSEMSGSLRARTLLTDIVTTFRYMQKKLRRQGDVILNVIVGICKQKGCICGNTLITKLQISEVPEVGRFVLSNFPGWVERADCEESEFTFTLQAVPGESKAQLHSFFTSAWGAGEWSSGTRYPSGRLGEPRRWSGHFGKRKGRESRVLR